jgi:hypothetical protein
MIDYFLNLKWYNIFVTVMMLNMEHNDQIIVDLRDKFKQIITLCDSYRAENEILKKENEQIKNKLNQKENDLTDIEEKYNNLKTAKALVSLPGNESQEVKTNINRIVREIDKCIALMNK